VQAHLSDRSLDSNKVHGDVHGAHVRDVDQSLDEAIELGVSGGCKGWKGRMVGWDGRSAKVSIKMQEYMPP
jgi:hypothetical protein